MTFDVFISHSSKDKATADAMCNWLEASGYRCWMAPRDIQAGETWAGAIVKGIEQSRLVVLVFTESANRSADVSREIYVASSQNLKIIPFRIEDAKPTGDMRYYLSTVHWLDALDGPLDGYLKKLGERLRLEIPRSEVAPTVTPPGEEKPLEAAPQASALESASEVPEEIFGGFEKVPTEQRKSANAPIPESRKNFYFLLFLATIIALLVAAVVSNNTLSTSAAAQQPNPIRF